MILLHTNNPSSRTLRLRLFTTLILFFFVFFLHDFLELFANFGSSFLMNTMHPCSDKLEKYPDQAFSILLLTGKKSILYIFVHNSGTYSTIVQDATMLNDKWLYRKLCSLHTLHIFMIFMIYMILLLGGNSEIGAHVRSSLWYLICLRHWIRSRAVTIWYFSPKRPH